MCYAAAKTIQDQRGRLRDRQLWNDGMSRFIDVQIELHEQVQYNDLGEMEPESLYRDEKRRKGKGWTKLSQDSLLEKRFTKEVLDYSTEVDEEIKQILADLDIEPVDCMTLSDTIDRNKDGCIDVMELISGLSRLRGPARRSDIVAVDLAIQSMQAKMDDIWLHNNQQQNPQQQQELRE